MPPSNAMENDKKRLRNQFTKDERARLLAIMTEYGPLLDDKNISILSRKEIWEIIENKFNENGHSGRTSAQLKKYWQNYKYHSKRTKIIHKEVPKPLSPMTKHMVRMLAKVNPEDWAQYDVAVNAVSVKKSPESSKSSPALVEWDPRPPKSHNNPIENRLSVSKIPGTPRRKSSTSSATDACLSTSDSRARPESSGIRCTGAENKISERNVVVSTTDVPGSSVTVSVICPEVSAKARTIFWKNNIHLREKVGQRPHSNYSDESERVIDDSRPEAAGSDICSEETDGRVNNAQSGRQVRDDNYENLGASLEAVGALRGSIQANSTRDNGRYHELLGDDDHLVRSVAGSRQKVSDNQPPINMKAAVRGRMDQSELIGNVIGVVKEIPAGKARLSKNCDPTERLGSVSMTNGRNETKNIPSSMGDSIRNPFGVALHQIISRENQITNGINEGNVIDADYSELSELLNEFSAVEESSKRTKIPGRVEKITDMELNKVANDSNFPQDLIQRLGQKREMDMIRYMMSRNTDSSTHDLLWFKLRQKLLRSVGQAGRNQPLEILREFGPLVSGSTSTNRRNDDNEPESSDCSYPAGSDQGMEVDEDTNAENGPGKLTAPPALSMAPNAAGNHIQRDIKIEADIEPESFDAGQNPLNDNSQDNRAMNSMHRLVQAKLQCAKSELDHQMKLQKLEVEEKELRVKIAEMTIQETRLRIRSLVEERVRAKEIHDLRLARMAAEKVRSEAEHAARIDASRITTAEARARIDSIERDRERSENFYQMQLRCLNASTANGNCGVKCKQYQN